MSDVIVERIFEDPEDLAAIQAIEDRGAWCLAEHGVRFVQTLFSRDRRRMICLYEAPDAESVRLAQRRAGMPLQRIWTATRNPAPPDLPGPDPGPKEHVVVERTFEPPLTPAALADLMERGAECLPRHRAAYVGGFLSLDGRRMICHFLAPDAESVRIANREARAPFDRAWTATLHRAPESGRGPR